MSQIKVYTRDPRRLQENVQDYYLPEEFADEMAEEFQVAGQDYDSAWQEAYEYWEDNY